MRVNVYAEEITGELEIVKKTADTGANFVGVRFFLRSPSELHHKPNDDDRSAVTFWVRSGQGGYKIGDETPLAALFRDAARQLEDVAYEAARQPGKECDK